MKKEVLINIIVASITGSVVFGLTMLTVVGTVRDHTNELVHLKAADIEIRAAQIEDRKRVDDRVFHIAGLVAKQTELTQKLITLVEVQNQVRKQ